MPRGIPNKSTDAQNNPVIANTALEASDNPVGQDRPRTMKSTGPAKDSLDPRHIVPVERPMDQEKLAMEAFMCQDVTIRIATNTDPMAEQVFELNINGRPELFKRGMTKTVKRYFLDKLARCKITGYSQREVVNAEGIRDILHDPHTGLRYDFAVIHDPHPRGAEWLRSVLAEAG